MRSGAGWADALADVKPFNSSIDARIVFHFYAAHFTGGRALSQSPFEIVKTPHRT